MAAGPATPSDRVPMAIPMGGATPTTTPIPETFAKDAIIAWFRGEFAAANAIIDALCNHLTQLDGLSNGGGIGSEYESVFAAIHRRRLNWIPVLHMQKYFSIADVAIELRRVAATKKEKTLLEEEDDQQENKMEQSVEKTEEVVEIKKEEEKREISVEELKESVQPEDGEEEASSDPKVLEEGLQEGQLCLKNNSICSNHDDCEIRSTRIKMTKGFVAKEPVKGHMVNVVKGLKLYEDIFTESELSKLTEYIDGLRTAGRKGALSGETFILFNQQLKGNKRELIQLGVPIFGHVKEEPKSYIEPIPPVLQAVIDHLVQWHLLPESRKPNSCIINFFDEDEYSQPYLKPPHLDQPISTLTLSESTLAFGRILVSDNNGNFKGPLMLTLKEGSLLVMRGNSADMARHVICPSANKRVSLTFCKVRPAANHVQPLSIPPLTKAMTLWQPGVPQPTRMPNGIIDGYQPMEVPKWGLLHSPFLMLAPVRPMVMNPRRLPHGGTGVFLPWTVGSKKHIKHLPPRAQRSRLLALPPTQTQLVEPIPDPSV
ncbi:Rna demethylase alkbh10b [Thalictrum thalictroides]|uniref:Rna demethylase alkbh10b n=1 Tax=Thalictrum thalictroides TaxID=46969 RepID=A0A7J6X920_THATH|nr:Rna demethylase alkbh10b [Thalictrum thalictroides]